MRDTGRNLGRWRATYAFLAGVALNLTATLVMVAYSEAVRRRKADRVLTCGADITHRDEEHRQSVCILQSGHEGPHDDGQGCTWT